MPGTLKRIMYSRAAWFAAVVLWLWCAVGTWYEALHVGFSALKIVQVVLTTGLAAILLWAFVANRAWRKRNEDAQ